jgi:hypothetical protein
LTFCNNAFPVKVAVAASLIINFSSNSVVDTKYLDAFYLVLIGSIKKYTVYSPSCHNFMVIISFF